MPTPTASQRPPATPGTQAPPVSRPAIPWSVWKTEVRETLILGGPVVGTQLAQILLSATDTVMAGRLGAADLASVALGGGVFYPLCLYGMGVLMSVSPTVSQLYGAGRHDEIGRQLHQGLWVALVLGVFTAGAAQFCEPIFHALDVNADLIPGAMGYLTAIAWGLPAMYCQIALRGMSDGVSRTRPMFFISLLSFPMNVFGNWVFMYGHFGMPRLGGVGCGVASAIVLWLNFFMMASWVYFSGGYRPYRVFERFEWPRWADIRKLLALGTPIGVGLFMECTLFAAGALLLGRFGDTVVAAHQAALNVASVTFMIPLGISTAASIRVGQAVGRRDPAAVRRAGFTGIGLAAFIMLGCATLLALAPGAIARLYSSDPAVLTLMSRLLLYAAVFQLFDGFQVASNACLRGLKDTSVPALITVVVYWVIGVPVAYCLAIGRGQQADGIWSGFIVALFLAAVLLTIRFDRISRRFASAAGSPGES